MLQTFCLGTYSRLSIQRTSKRSAQGLSYHHDIVNAKADSQVHAVVRRLDHVFHQSHEDRQEEVQAELEDEEVNHVEVHVLGVDRAAEVLEVQDVHVADQVVEVQEMIAPEVDVVEFHVISCRGEQVPPLLIAYCAFTPLAFKLVTSSQPASTVLPHQED